MKEIKEEINQIIDGIKAGEITKEELDVTIQKMNELNEQLIILKYKYFTEESNNSTLDTLTEEPVDNDMNDDEQLLDFDLNETDFNEREEVDDKNMALDSEKEKSFDINDLSLDEKRIFRIVGLVKSNRRIVANDSLIKMFLLNEKLMFINELFDGSSEAFAKAVREIDEQNDLKQAINVISELNKKYHWELDSETVEEFVFKICCRFA